MSRFLLSTLGSFIKVQELGTAGGTEQSDTDPHSQLRQGEEEVAVTAGACFKWLG